MLVVHVNDSKNERGAHKDRHENIGYGHIGFETLNHIVHHPKLKDVPKFLKEIVTVKESFKQEKINTQLLDEKLRKKRLEKDALHLELEEKKRIIAQSLQNQSIDGLPTEFEQKLIEETCEPLQLAPNELTEEAQSAISVIIQQDE